MVLIQKLYQFNRLSNVHTHLVFNIAGSCPYALLPSDLKVTLLLRSGIPA